MTHRTVAPEADGQILVPAPAKRARSIPIPEHLYVSERAMYYITCNVFGRTGRIQNHESLAVDVATRARSTG